MRDKIREIRKKHGALRLYLRPFVTLMLLIFGYFYLVIVFIWIVLLIIKK